MKKYILVALSILSLTCFGQNRVHLTERTKIVHMENPAYASFGPCHNGIISITSNYDLYVIDTLGNQAQYFPGVKGACSYEEGDVTLIVTRHGGTSMLPEDDVSLVNRSGKVLKKFTKVAFFSRFVDGMATIGIDGKGIYGIETWVYLIDNTGKFVHPETAGPRTTWTPNKPFQIKCGRRKYYDYQKKTYGYMNSAGTIVVPATFEKAHDYSEDVAMIYKDNHWGAINLSGKFLWEPCLRNEPGDFHDGLAHAQLRNGKYVFIQKNGSYIDREFSSVRRFFNGYAVADNGAFKGTFDDKPVIIDTKLKRVKMAPNLGFGKYEFYDDLKMFKYSNVLYTANGIPYTDFNDNYGRVEEFVDGIAVYHGKINGKDTAGYVNYKGELIIIFQDRNKF